MTDWDAVERGMKAARSSPDVGTQATSAEACEAGGTVFLGNDHLGRSPDWHIGYDHAIILARGASRGGAA